LRPQVQIAANQRWGCKDPLAEIRPVEDLGFVTACFENSQLARF
jgi:hypothetical protein